MTRWLGCVLLLSACPPSVKSGATLEGEGFSVKVEAAPFSLRIVDSAGATRLETRGGPRTTFDAFSVEPQIVPGWDGFKSHERAWKQWANGTLAHSDATSAMITFADDAGVVSVTVKVDGASVRLEQTADTSGLLNASALAFAMSDTDHFFGLGQRTATFDHRGHSLYSWPEEGGLAGGEDAGISTTNPYPNGPSMTYFPVPFVHTTRGLAVWADTYRRSTFDFGTVPDEPETWRVRVLDRKLALVFFVREAPLQAIDDFTALTGRPLIPPPWAFGPRRRINRWAKVDGVDEWQLHRDRKLPLTAIDDATHFLPAGSQVGIEDELNRWTNTLHAAGYKAMAYNNPYVSKSSDRSRSDYDFGAANGFFEQEPDGGPATSFFLSGGPQTISTIDLTNPQAVEWFKGLLSRTLDAGYDGWMHDFGEYVNRTSRFSNGATGEDEHNRFPVRSAKACFDLLQGTDKLCFIRSGYTGSQAYAFDVWGGDPEASFDDAVGLPAMLRGGLNLSMTGVPYWSSDIGGYKCLTTDPHDKEMLVRWYLMGAVAPMMHDEDACSNPVGGNRVKARLWDDQETQDIYRTAASLHTRLAPYFRALALRANETGRPITISPWLLFPKEVRAWSIDDAFFVGPSLYAAPVVRRGERTKTIWLPPGRYVEWTERTPHQGPGEVTVPAPLGRLPLFLVENQLLPLLDAEVQTLAQATNPGVVSERDRASVIDVVGVLGPPGSTASFTLADGTRFEVRRSPTSGTNTCAECSIDTTRPARRVTFSGTSTFADVEATTSFVGTVRWAIFELD